MKKALTVFLLGVLLAGCAAEKKTLDENQAIKAGNGFLKLIMLGEYQAAYDKYMSSSIKFDTRSNLEQFTADWQTIAEEYGKQTKAVFEAYQLVPGKRVIQLYYTVSHEKSGDITYHLVLEQGRDGAFTLFLVDIGNEVKYPSTGQPTEKLKKDETIEIAP